MDTANFSFEALMTMNTAKVKKKKKIKTNVDESDTSCLLFDTKSTSLKSLKSKEQKDDPDDQMTDRDAAILASTRARGGGKMMGSQSKKTKYVAKVYTLFELSQKMLENYPMHLLSCMHSFVFPADIIMPALERLDEKSLHMVNILKIFNI
jgi:hypothetical protein